MIKHNPNLVGDGNWPFEMAKPVKNESIVVPPPPTAQDAADVAGLPSYQMKSSPRGIGLIINNKKFSCGLPERNGTDKDAASLQQLFTYLGFYTNFN